MQITNQVQSWEGRDHQSQLEIVLERSSMVPGGLRRHHRFPKASIPAVSWHLQDQREVLMSVLYLSNSERSKLGEPLSKNLEVSKKSDQIQTVDVSMS